MTRIRFGQQRHGMIGQLMILIEERAEHQCHWC
jgi:hypothetical protein